MPSERPPKEGNMRQRHSHPSPQPPRPPARPGGKAAAEAFRKARVLALKAKIRRGLYDADGKIDGILEEVLKDAC